MRERRRQRSPLPCTVRAACFPSCGLELAPCDPQVAGRSSGQVPLAALHDIISESNFRNTVVKACWPGRP
ncbi:hypothetical protein DESC_720301 [Desulfosarcina cetonica]|nr:hypothetical protein DESC_720301 [Desulfosarcina cetonica]